MRGTRARARGSFVAGGARRGGVSFVGAHLPVLVVLPVLLRRPGAGQLGMLLVALRRQRAAGERHRDSARGRLRLFQMRAGPRPSRARRARGAAPLGRVAARDLLEVELLSAARRRPHLATHSRPTPGGGRFLPAQRKSPSPRCVACEPGAFGRPSPAATRALSAASSELARWILYVAALTVVSARAAALCSRAPSTRLARPVEEIPRRAPDESTGASGDKSARTATGASFPSRKT